MASTRGRSAEDRALRHLQDAGLRLKARNYRCRLGEIDLVMEDNATLVFVEVRLRSNPRYGSGADSVDFRKRRKLIAAAHHYLQTLAVLPVCRFDVVALDGAGGIDWIRGAFEGA